MSFALYLLHLVFKKTLQFEVTLQLKLQIL